MMMLYSTLACIFCLKIINAADQGKKIFLVEAVKQNNTELIQWLLREGADVNVQNDDGWTPLMYASIMNNIDIMQVLLTSGADVDMRKGIGNGSEVTALQLSVSVGAVNAVKLLFEKMKGTNHSNGIGLGVLSYAVLSDNEDIFKYLLEQGIEKLEKENTDGLPAIHTAALLGKTSLLKILILDEGMDVDLKNKQGETPLFVATKNGEFGAAEFLINAGADVNTEVYGITPLFIAASKGDLKLVKLLVENKCTLDSVASGSTPLFTAVLQGHFAVAEYLTNQGSDILFRDNRKNGIMYAASLSGNTKLIDFFIRRNISIDEVNGDGAPLIAAIEAGHEEAVKLLMQNGADKITVRNNKESILQNLLRSNNVNGIKCLELIDETMFYNTSDSFGKTILHDAAMYSDESMVKYILEQMVSHLKKNEPITHGQKRFDTLGICFPCYMRIANIKDNIGRTPLHDAVEYGNYKVIDVLINHGAFINISDNMGITPLHTAASVRGAVEALKSLVIYRPNLNALDYRGRTPLYISVEAGHLDSVKYLIDIGADTTLDDKQGWSLLHVAAANGSAQLMQELLKIGNLKSTKINSTDTQGRTPAWHAISRGHLNVLSLLEINRGQIDQEHLCQALKSDRFKLGRPKSYKNLVLFSNEFNLDNFIEIYKTENNSQLFMLTKYPCFINLPDEENKTALWYAAAEEKTSAYYKLLSAGGEMHPKVTMQEAIQKNLIGLVKYLIMNGTSCKLTDEGGWPMIFLAALYGHTDIVEYLIDCGANINSSTPGWNWSPLHAAAWVGHSQTVEMLLKRGADANRLNSRRETALNDAKPSCSLILQKYGARYGARYG